MAQRKTQPKADQAQTTDAQPSPLGEASTGTREATTQTMTNGTKREDF